tara:strand:- start:969 stop:1532 length:564 start_codon:yes stop_codon:yes gene_type:complete
MRRVELFALSILFILNGCFVSIPYKYSPIYQSGKKIPLYKVYDENKLVSHVFHKYKFYSRIYERFMIIVIQNKSQKKIKLKFRYIGDDWIFFDRIIIMNDKKDRMIWSVHNLDQNIDIINKKNNLEEVDFTIRHEQVMRLEKLLKNADKVKFWLMGKEDAIFSISDQDRLANLEVINYYKKLNLKTS